MGPSMDLLIDHQVETTHSNLHRILDLVTETTATQVAMTHKLLQQTGLQQRQQVQRSPAEPEIRAKKSELPKQV